MSDNIELIATDDINSKEALSKSLVDWVKVNDLIKQFEEELKELRQKKTDIQKRNIEFMKVNDLDYVEIGHGTQVNLIMTRNKLSNITKARLPTKLEEYFERKKNYDKHKSEKAVKEILEFLEEEPVYSESAYLKKYEPKG